MAQASEAQLTTEPYPTPVDGGTLLPPTIAPEGNSSALPGLNSADSSLISDTSHVQQLINHGADVNAPDNNGWTPLHTAAYHGQEEIVRILLAANANVNARNRAEETPLHLAAKWPQDRVVEALLSGGADLTARNKRGRTPAHVAALFNRHAILDRLLSAGADVNAMDVENQTPLHLAVRANCPVEPELVKTLIRHNANLEVQDVRGHGPLHFLPCAQDWLHWAAYEGKERLMEMLLAKPGMRPDCYSEEGLTPLHLAAHVNSTSMVTMLLNAGAKVNAPSQPPTKSSGKESTYGIPLPGAPGSITAGISISSQLKAYGSSKLPPGELTALHIAAERGSAELIRVLVGAGAKVNVQGERGMPPLHVAVWEGNTAAVVSLLAAKASVSLKSKAGGFTSVHCACLSSRATPELLALLLDNGGAAVIEERCQEGWTALHLACQSAPPAMVELLLQRGARPGAKGKNGRTAADCAAKRPEILQILHVATGGKVPLPLGLTSVAAAAANTLLMPNGGANAAGAAGAGAAGSSGARGGGGAGGGSRSRSGPGSAGASGAGTARSPSSSSSSQSGLLPGTAAVLEPLESVEATLAALLADMGGALCSLQAGAVFGAGACAVDPVGHCIRPLDKRLVMVCTLGCQFSFHLQCWKSAREVLKERWSGFSGSLAAGGRYCCIGPGCPGYIREQAICDGTQMQTSSYSRLYFMEQDVYDSLPPQAKPIGGGVPPPPGGGDGCINVGGVQQPGTPLQPALPAGGGGLPSLAALAPSLTLAQAMMQAAQAVGNMVGNPGRLGTSQLAAALASGGSLQALLANPPPIPQAMSAREAAIVAAQTLGVMTPGSSCVVEELGSGDEYEDDDGLGDGRPGALGGGAGSAVPGGGGAGSSGSAASRSGGSAGTSSSRAGAGSGFGSSAAANGGGSGGKKQSGGGGGGASSSRRGGKSGGAKTLGCKSSAGASVSSAAAAEMLQQLQGLQQAVAAVQSAVGKGVHSMNLVAGDGAVAGLGSGGGSGGSGGNSVASGTAAVAPSAAAQSTDTSAAGGEGAGSSTPTVSVATLEPPPRGSLPPATLAPGSGPFDTDGAASCSGGNDGAGNHLQDAAPMPPPRRRTPPMPPMSRRVPQPLSCAVNDPGQQPVSPQLATPPPATSLLTPGVQQLLPSVGSSSAAAAASLPRQPDASLAPILVGPVPQPSPLLPAPAAAAAAAGGKTTVSPSRTGGLQSGDNGAGSSADPAGATSANGSVASTASSPVTGAAAGTAAHGNGVVANLAKADIGAASPGAPGPAGVTTSSNGTGSRSPPHRSTGGTASPNPVSSGSAKHELLTAIANGQAASAAYGGRVTLTAPGLSIGFVRGVPLATLTSSQGVSCIAAAGVGASQGVAAQAGQGTTASRAVGARAGAHPVPLPLNPASFEPGGYARAVCPGLRQGVHRVTHSSGRVPPPPGATIVQPSKTECVADTATGDQKANAEPAEGSGGETVACRPGTEGAATGAGPQEEGLRAPGAVAPGVSEPTATASESKGGAAAEPKPTRVSAVTTDSKAREGLGRGGSGNNRVSAAASPAGPQLSASPAEGETTAAVPELRLDVPLPLDVKATSPSEARHSVAPASGSSYAGQGPAGIPSPATAIPALTQEPALGLEQPAGPLTATAAATTGIPVPATAGAATNGEQDIVLAALNGLKETSIPNDRLVAEASPSPKPLSSAGDVASNLVTLEVRAPAASSQPQAAAAVPRSLTGSRACPTSPAVVPEPQPDARGRGASRHLLLESGDIPLLASTPGMLEAWLSAHVGTHGRLLAHRILASQAAVAVSLESDTMAEAAARSLRQRPQLLVQPLSVSPLREFPDDEVLAASAQQVAKASCSPGDRSWMRRMAQLWQQLETLPPALRYE